MIGAAGKCEKGLVVNVCKARCVRKKRFTLFQSRRFAASSCALVNGASVRCLRVQPVKETIFHFEKQFRSIRASPCVLDPGVTCSFDSSQLLKKKID